MLLELELSAGIIVRGPGAALLDGGDSCSMRSVIYSVITKSRPFELRIFHLLRIGTTLVGAMKGADQGRSPRPRASFELRQ